MESLLFMLNSIVIVLMIFMSLRDERRAPDEAPTSFFRMMPAGTPVAAAPSAEAPAWPDWTQAEAHNDGRPR